MPDQPFVSIKTFQANFSKQSYHNNNNDIDIVPSSILFPPQSSLHFNNNNNNTINIWSDQPQNSPNLFIQTFQHTLTVDDMPMGLIGFTIRAGKPS